MENSVAASSSLAGGQSLREKQKTRTLRELRAAALKLFATRGYDATTIDEIAEHFGVSAHTLFRYFPTKDLLLFLGQDDWMQSLAEDYPAQPRALSELDAMCATIVSQTPRLVRLPQSLLLFIKAVDSSPTLGGRDQNNQQAKIVKLVQAVASRQGLADVEESCWLVAAVGLACYRHALHAWLIGDSLDLGEVVAAEFKALTREIGSR
jgi:AcrR family transcriptional regulator